MDELEENNAWKRDDASSDYDPEAIKRRLQQLDEARINYDAPRMLFLVRTALTRNLGNMGNVKLYKYSHTGTKALIDRYIASALQTIKCLVEASERLPSGDHTKLMLEQVVHARQAFGRSALLLSGGGTFGMNHTGVLKALWEEKLLPRIISGASAGSIVSAVICCRTDEEVPELMETFCHGDLAVFEEKGRGDSVLRKAARFLKYGAFFDISHLTRIMRELIGDLTFQEGYNRTRRILNITVSSASLYELPRLLNYVTAPNVLIWSAVAASCSVPLVFSSASLLAKDARTGQTVPWNPSPQKLIDGSVDNDLPMTRLAEMFNVNHFIVSQVNPHVVPFLVKEEITNDPRLQDPSGSSWLQTFTDLAKGEALYRMQTAAEMGIFPTALTKAVSVLSQKYSGDITILPEISYANFPNILSNPSEEFMTQAMLAGERATWPKLSRIRNHCAIELALDDAVQKLRTRVVFSSSQTDLRLGAIARASTDSRKQRQKIRAGTGHRRRKLSEPDASIARAVREGLVPSNQRHHKTRSLVNPRALESTSTVQTMLTHPEAEPHSPIPSSSHRLDPLSSGAENAENIFTSDGDADDDSCSSPASVHSFEHELEDSSGWSRRLSSSLPPTPAGYRNTLGDLAFTPSNPSRSGKSIKTNKPLPHTPTDPVSKPSPQEARYKKLFHSGKARAKAAVIPEEKATSDAASQPTSPDTSSGRVRRVNALGLELNLAPSKGISIRKKRSD